MRCDQTLTGQSEHHTAYQDGRITLGISSNRDGELEDSDSGSQGDQTDSYSQIVNQEANEKGSKDVREGEDSIEQLKLCLTNAQIFLHVLFESLWVVESVLIAEYDHGDEKEDKEAYFLAAEGLWGILHAGTL